MHYKNGRKACEGDFVIGKQGDRTVAGVLHGTASGCSSCNGQIAMPTVIGVQSTYVTIGECFHVEDAFACIEAEWAKNQAEIAKLDNEKK